MGSTTLDDRLPPNGAASARPGMLAVSFVGGALGAVLHAVVAVLDGALRGAAIESILRAAALYACAGLVVGSVAAGAAEALRARGLLRGHGAFAVALPLPLTLVYLAIEFNRSVLIDYNIYSRVSIVCTLALVSLVVLGAWLLTRSIDARFVGALTLPPGRARLAAAAAWLVPFAALPLATSSPPSTTPVTTGRAPPGAPNVLVLVSDCLRADHVSASGYDRPTTPTFDRIASEGVRFTDAHAAASWTLPSVVGLLTSVPPGLELAPGGLSARVAAITVPEILAQHGYSSYAASNNPHLSGPFGVRDRFQAFDDGVSPLATALDATVLGNLRQRISLPLDADVVAAARRRIATLDEPFFVYVHVMGGHGPYELPAGASVPFEIPAADREVTGPYEGMEITDAERANLVGRYDALVRIADDLFGTILDDLAARGSLDRTLVIYTGDHGEAFGEHDQWGHGTDLHSETVRVPLAVRLPGRIAPGVRADVVSLLDVPATIVRAVGTIERPSSFRGSGLRLFDTPSARLAALGPGGFAASELGPSLRSAVTHEWKYVLDVRSGAEWLYDRRSDVGETIDVSTRDINAASVMREMLAQFVRGGAADALVPTSVDIPADLAAQLEALGYVAADDATP